MIELQIILGCSVISCALTYAWWTSVRVALLREDIFVLRDQLFDKAQALGGLDDPAYRSARDALNGLIRFAHMWSWPILIAAIFKGGTKASNVVSNDSALRREIEAVTLMAAKRHVRFLVFETLTGWVFLLLSAVLYPVRMAGHWLETRVRLLLETHPDVPHDSGMVTS